MTYTCFQDGSYYKILFNNEKGYTDIGFVKDLGGIFSCCIYNHPNLKTSIEGQGDSIKKSIKSALSNAVLYNINDEDVVNSFKDPIIVIYT